ncbi:AAA family ATPase [Chloroflexota bacterium]
MQQSQPVTEVERLVASLGQLPEPVVQPTFVVVGGLPGTGKSYFCRRLAQRLPSIILESDALRKILFSLPDYSPQESARLFQAAHLLTGRLLKKGIPVILDATNLAERHREQLYNIADRLGARLILVWIEAPPDVVRQRLEARKEGVNPANKSDADWEVYQRMKPGVQKIRRHHLVVDTSRDIYPVMDKIVRVARH